ncbi:MAG: flagellar biosynthesis protein FlhF [Pseudomonadales bacterium]
MTTRTILAKDMQDAMVKAKDEMGADAIILKSRKLGDHIEVVVTDDPSFLIALSKDKQKAPAKKTAPSPAVKAETPAANDETSFELPLSESIPQELAPTPAPKRTLAELEEQFLLEDAENSINLIGQIDEIDEAVDLESLDFIPNELIPSELTPPTPPKTLLNAELPKATPEPIHLPMPESNANDQEAAIDAGKFPFKTMHDPALKRLVGELRSIGEFWNEFGIYWETYAESYQYPWSKQLRERVDYLNLSPALRDQLVSMFREIPEFEQSWQSVLSELQSNIVVSEHDVIRNGGTFAFVGPSGAGKTTTIGKLAAEYVLQHSPEEVGLITTDIFRIAAYEQLVTMGKILDVEVEVVDAHQGGLTAAIKRFSDKSLVLIDTAGLRSTDRDLAKQMHELRQLGERVSTMLVLPANVQYESMQRAMETYETRNYQGCIFTRLDECPSLGPAVSLLVSHGIPAAYLASGHTIPDDLARATPSLLIEQLLTFACQETDVSKIDGGGLASAIEPHAERQIELI